MNRPHNTFRSESEADRILSLIERHCPRLMKTGGGSFGGDRNLMKFSDEDLQKALAMRARGVPNVEIAAALKFSASTISKNLRAHAAKNGIDKTQNDN